MKFVKKDKYRYCVIGLRESVDEPCPAAGCKYWSDRLGECLYYKLGGRKHGDAPELHGAVERKD